MSRYAAAHAFDKLTGPGDGRPTAQQIVQDYNKVNALQGKTILITGVSSGIGTASALALAATGATIFAAGRSILRAKKALASIADSPNIYFLELDLASRASVKSFAIEFLKQSGGKIHILMNNAGCVLAERSITEDGVENLFAVNYLNPFLLFSLLKDTLLSSATEDFPSRVINLTSMGHRASIIHFENINHIGDYQGFAAYAQAKTAAIYMASEIERRYGSRNLHGWSVHPGTILESNFAASSGYDNATFTEILLQWPKKCFKTNEQGAATQVWAAISDDVLVEGARGKYLEDVSVSKPKDETDSPELRGYVDHTYDEPNAIRLWEVGEGLLGIKV